jgi:hypothetical protein
MWLEENIYIRDGKNGVRGLDSISQDLLLVRFLSDWPFDSVAFMGIFLIFAKLWRLKG